MSNVALRFRLQRQMQLLRRAWASVQDNGWRATWRRARPEQAQEQAPHSADRPATGDDAWAARPWVLVVDGSVPAPDRDSGSLRLLNLMQAMLSAGYRVAFIPDEGGSNSARAGRLREIGIHVPVLAGTGDAIEWVGRRRASLSAAIVCRHHAAGHWLPFLRSVAPRARIVFDTVDLHFLREQRAAELRGDRRLARRAAATRRRELRLVAEADTTWVVSTVERDMLQGACPQADVRVVSNIIDEDTPGRPFDQREGLLFVGGLRHPPNRDAVDWLAREILPRIRRTLADVELHLVGDTGGFEPAAAPGIVAHGHVPDLAPLLDTCRIALAPLRFGAGVKGKINLSMAHGQPVVATTCAIEGMHLQPGVDVLVADDADAFAAEVVRLHGDAGLWQQLSTNGRENVRRHFSPAVALEAVRASLGPPAAQDIPCGSC